MYIKTAKNALRFYMMPVVAYRITVLAFITCRVAAITGCQNTVINMKSQIIDVAYSDCVCLRNATLCRPYSVMRQITVV